MQSTDDDESDGDLNQRHMSASDARVRRDVSLIGDGGYGLEFFRTHFCVSSIMYK